MRSKFKNLFDKEVIVDTNTIIDLQELASLDLPLRVFSSVYISGNILREELNDEDRQALLKLNYKPLNLETNNGYEKLFYLKENYTQLSTPDKVIISIAYEKGIFCCTNDSLARKACKDIEVKLTGTIGVLCSAYENNVIKREEFIELFNKYNFITSSYLSKNLTNTIRKLYNISNLSVKNSFNKKTN